MNEDILMINMPQYHIEYVDEEYSYLGSGRVNLKKALYKASHGYCMYCYNRIQIDGNEYGHLEHAIECSIASKKLKECIPNIGLACAVCNGKYKRIGEKKRIPDSEDIINFNENACCGKEFCREPCEAYIALKKAYFKRKCAWFIM